MTEAPTVAKPTKYAMVVVTATIVTAANTATVGKLGAVTPALEANGGKFYDVSPYKLSDVHHYFFCMLLKSD